MGTRLTSWVRLKGTHITGQIHSRYRHGNEILYRVLWDAGIEGEYYYRDVDLEPLERPQRYSTGLLSSDSKHRHELERLRTCEEGGTLFEPKRRDGYRRG